MSELVWEIKQENKDIIETFITLFIKIVPK
jgi:hypothetical protein